MPRARRSVRLLSGLVVASLLVAACGDDVEPQTTSPPDTIASAETATAPESTGESTTTAAPDTTGAAPETTAAPAPAPASTTAPAASGRNDLTLRSNGVGASDFGQTDAEVVSYVSASLGAPVSDEPDAYPVFDAEFNEYTNAEDVGFTTPFGRTTCYDNRFCLYFGGETSDALRFVGWSQESLDALSDPLATADGVTVGSRQSDHIGTMTVNDFGCFSDGSGEVAGILLLVRSEGEPFEFVDEAGNFVRGDPAPEEIVVTALEAGDRPYFLFADC